MLQKPLVLCSILHIFLSVLLVPPSLAEADLITPYGKGSIIDSSVSIHDVSGQEVRLVDLLRAQDKPFSVVYIFGGGAMGAQAIQRGIWCQDSFEDLYILRSLVDRYKDHLGFIAIAEPPVFHTQQMAHVDRAFLNYSQNTAEYKTAHAAFIESTQNAMSKGTVPVQPYYDIGFRLLMSQPQQSELDSHYGEIPGWQGAFRAPDEKQTYGVPALWLVDQSGKVLSEPFRGNVYHPHGDDKIVLNYSLRDVLTAVEKHLK